MAKITETTYTCDHCGAHLGKIIKGKLDTTKITEKIFQTLTTTIKANGMSSTYVSTNGVLCEQCYKAYKKKAYDLMKQYSTKEL